MPTRARFLALFAMAIMLFACARHTVVPRYHTLDATPPSPPPASSAKRTLAIAIGPVTVADYLDQALIAFRDVGGVVHLAEFERWANPLNEGVQALLMQRLEAGLPGVSVAAFPREPAFRFDYRVSVDVIRLDAVPGGVATLNARYRIFDAETGQWGAEQQFIRDEHSDSDNIEGLVGVKSRLLAAFGDSITDSFKSPLMRHELSKTK